MEGLTPQEIQREAAEALLDHGVSVPLKDIRLPFTKRKLRLRMTVKRPRLAGQIECARLYLTIGKTADEIEDMPKMEQMRMIAGHGATLSLILANMVCQGYVSRHLFKRTVAWIIRNFVDYEYQLAAARTFESLMGTDPFIPIIRLAERTNPMKPRLSREKKGS